TSSASVASPAVDAAVPPAQDTVEGISVLCLDGERRSTVLEQVLLVENRVEGSLGLLTLDGSATGDARPTVCDLYVAQLCAAERGAVLLVIDDEPAVRVAALCARVQHHLCGTAVVVRVHRLEASTCRGANRVPSGHGSADHAAVPPQRFAGLNACGCTVVEFELAIDGDGLDALGGLPRLVE